MNYFSHDYDSINDVKMQDVLMQMGQEGIGIFWCLVEIMYKEGGRLELAKCNNYAFALHVDSEKINTLINIIFETDAEYFWSKSVLKRIKLMKEKSKVKKLAANKRWENEAKTTDADAMHMDSTSNADAMHNKEKESKEIKIKERARVKTSDYLLTVPFDDCEELSGAYNCTPTQVQGKADDLLNYCKAKGKAYKDYKAFLRNALKKDFGVRKPTSNFNPAEAAPEISEEQRKRNIERIAVIKSIHQVKTVSGDEFKSRLKEGQP